MEKKASANGVRDKAFVVSQIGDENSDIRIRADEVLDFVIAPVAADFDLDVIRSDLDATPGHVTSRLIKSILDSRVIIADLSGRNANVYYELGVVHSFRLPVVILVDHVASLSFDTQHERVIEIGDDGTITARQADIGKKKLRETLDLVLKSGYTPSSLVTEVAEAQSLAKLAPSDPIASEIATIKQKLDEVMVMVRASVTAGGAGGGTARTHTISYQPTAGTAAPVNLGSSPLATSAILENLLKSDQHRYEYMRRLLENVSVFNAQSGTSKPKEAERPKGAGKDKRPLPPPPKAENGPAKKAE